MIDPPGSRSALVLRFYDAFETGDSAAFEASCADDVEWAVCGVSECGVRRGREAVARWLARARVLLDERRFEVERVVEAGDTVIVVGHGHARERATGESSANARVHVWTVREGRISRVQDFVETEPIETEPMHVQGASETSA
ncbi:MAG: nuclear transport factor 2 family protein [Thermoplasmatota archaeon]